MPSSAAEGEPLAELFVTPRTLRGTLGEAFVRTCVQLFERDHGPDSGCFTASARTVELTVVAVSASGPVAVAAGIADPAFSGAGRGAAGGAGAGARLPATPPGPGGGIDVDALPGIGGLRGPDGVDLRRWASVRMLDPGQEGQPVEPARLRIRVVTP
ncbi:hypothetical protein [Herbiconiux sp.]|uniref:hypothetical protein n=1 Tax=Herbiconiux sp. TaxID=1871186 RepID=UPI0025BBF629|nr:hypothetical protein [Herbiconiux sp.]